MITIISDGITVNSRHHKWQFHEMRILAQYRMKTAAIKYFKFHIYDISLIYIAHHLPIYSRILFICFMAHLRPMIFAPLLKWRYTHES